MNLYLVIAIVWMASICCAKQENITSPNDTILIGGTMFNPTLDINLAKSNHWINGITFNNWTKTVLIGSDTYPDVSGTLAPNGAQLMIVGRETDNRQTFMVVGNYRSGTNGDRYTLTIGPDGDLTTNAYIQIWGTRPSQSVHDPSMLSISSDVENGILFPGGGYDVNLARHIKAYGPVDKNGFTPVVFTLSGQGTISIFNPYGAVGGVNYAKPGIILGDIGYDANTPDWHYSQITQDSDGNLIIGTYDPPTNGLSQQFRIHSNGDVDIVENGDVRFKVDHEGHTTIYGDITLAPIARPSSPIEGNIYSDFDHHQYRYNGSSWTQMDN